MGVQQDEEEKCCILKEEILLTERDVQGKANCPIWMTNMRDVYNS